MQEDIVKNLYVHNNGNGWAVFKKNNTGRHTHRDFAWDGLDWCLSVAKYHKTREEADTLMKRLVEEEYWKEVHKQLCPRYGEAVSTTAVQRYRNFLNQSGVAVLFTHVPIEDTVKRIIEAGYVVEKMLPYLHVYSQGQWHSDAYIVGTTESLKALRDAIDKAINEGPTRFEATVNDGEGFWMGVVCTNDQVEIDKLAVPYTEEFAQEHREDASGPWDIWPTYTTIEPWEPENE